MPPDFLLLGLIVFAGIFVMTTAGFGSALVIMPLLTLTAPFDHARALMALVMLVTSPMLIWTYRHAIQLREITPVIIGAAPATLVGVFLPNFVGRQPVLITAGIVIIAYAAYAVYALTAPRVPKISSRNWGYGFGLASGLLYGSFNIGGPPVVVFATGRRWSPNTLRANVQIQSILITFVLLAGHAFNGNITQDVGIDLAVAVPFLIAAILIGVRLNRYINPTVFRRIVLALLIVLGLQLIVSGLSVKPEADPAPAPSASLDPVLPRHVTHQIDHAA